jgi:hypothetical protein
VTLVVAPATNRPDLPLIGRAELSAYAIAMLPAQLQREKVLVEIKGWRSKRSRMIIAPGSTAK